MGTSDRPAKVGLAWVTAAATMSGCNQLIGLSEFDTVDTYPDAGIPADAQVATPTSSDAGPDADQKGALTRTRRWARWSVSSGSDETMYAFDPSAGTFRDNRTNITWRTVPVLASTLDEATRACAALSDGPFWLPSRIELLSLMFTESATFYAPSLDDAGAVASGTFWTASTRTGAAPTAGTDEVYVVSFATGETLLSTSVAQGSGYFARCRK